jgi:(S)-2-hydroxy-acid oxidase
VYILSRILRDVNKIDTRTTVFGSTICLPIAFAPSATQRLAGGEGELDVVRTASNPGLNMTLSSQSTTSLEEVMTAAKLQAAGGGGVLSPKFWFQIYMTPDMNHSIALIKRAEGTVPMTVKNIKLGGC